MRSIGKASLGKVIRKQRGERWVSDISYYLREKEALGEIQRPLHWVI